MKKIFSMLILILVVFFVIGCVPVSKTGTDSKSSAGTTSKTIVQSEASAVTDEASVDTEVSEIDALEKELDSSADIDEIDAMLKELE